MEEETKEKEKEIDKRKLLSERVLKLSSKIKHKLNIAPPNEDDKYNLLLINIQIKEDC